MRDGMREGLEVKDGAYLDIVEKKKEKRKKKKKKEKKDKKRDKKDTHKNAAA